MNQSDAETIGTAIADAGFNFAATLPADQLHALQAWVFQPLGTGEGGQLGHA